MSIRLEEDRGGLVLVVHVSGKLVTEDYERFVPEFERLVREHGKLRVLFDMTGFCKPFTRAEIRYFDQPHVEEARAWLDAA